MIGWLDDLERTHRAAPFTSGVVAKDGTLFRGAAEDWNYVLSCCNVVDEEIETIAALINAAPRLLAVARAAERLLAGQAEFPAEGHCRSCWFGYRAHTGDCPWLSLQAALSGPTAPASGEDAP